MKWIRQNNKYVRQKIVEEVDLNSLSLEIKELQKQIANLEKELLPYPRTKDKRLKEAVDMWNQVNIFAEKTALEEMLLRKEELKAKLSKI